MLYYIYLLELYSLHFGIAAEAKFNELSLMLETFKFWWSELFRYVVMWLFHQHIWYVSLCRAELVCGLLSGESSRRGQEWYGSVGCSYILSHFQFYFILFWALILFFSFADHHIIGFLTRFFLVY